MAVRRQPSGHPWATLAAEGQEVNLNRPEASMILTLSMLYLFGLSQAVVWWVARQAQTRRRVGRTRACHVVNRPCVS
jgi:hypothetical protein